MASSIKEFLTVPILVLCIAAMHVRALSSPQALKFLLALRKRADQMRRHHVSPLSISQYAERFDRYFEYHRERRKACQIHAGVLSLGGSPSLLGRAAWEIAQLHPAGFT